MFFIDTSIEDAIDASAEVCVQQTNGCDCGVYTIANAISVSLNVNPLVYGFSVQENMAMYRQKLCIDCRNERIDSLYL